MPEFEFKAPDGKTYSVSGPEGATEAQAFEMLQKQHPELAQSSGQTPADAQSQDAGPPKVATLPNGQPNLAPARGREEAPWERPVKAIASATAMGGVLGAASPEILQGVGAAASAVGLGAIGAPIAATGRALRTARIAEAAWGAASGLASEAAGQLADKDGVSTGIAEGVRMGVGMATPMVGGLALSALKPLPKLLGYLFSGAKKEGGESISAAAQAARDKLRGPWLDNQPQHDLHAALAKGAQESVQEAEGKAQQVLAQAHQKAAEMAKTNPEAAQKIIDEAKAAGDKLKAEARTRANALDKATAGKTAIAERVRVQGDQELQKVGSHRELSDIGKELRGQVTGKQAEAIAARQQEYSALKAQRDAVVSQKEAAGEFVDKLPAMRELQAEIDKKILATKAGRTAAQGKASVTEPGVEKAYQNVWDAIRNKRVQTGVNAEGAPTYETFKTTFDAIDHVRRKLGDVAFGGEKEGYGALGQGIAKDLYAKLSKVQKEYAGEAQEKLLASYSEHSAGLTKFGTAVGKKLTAVDRMDPEMALKDPKELPAAFFKSQQGVRDLRELTQDSAGVDRAAADYMVSKLAGHDAKGVLKYLNDPVNTDWIREVPGLREKGLQYAQKLEKIERVETKLYNKTQALQAEKGRVLQSGEQSAQKMRELGLEEASKRTASRVEEQQAVKEAGQKEAEAVRTAAQTQAERIAGPKGGVFPPEQVQRLLRTGTPQEIGQAAKYAAQTPEGKQALVGSVRTMLADASPGQLKGLWNDRLKIALGDSGVVPRTELAKLDKDVAEVLKRHEPKAALPLVRAMIVRAMTTVERAAVSAPQRALSGDYGRGPD